MSTTTTATKDKDTEPSRREIIQYPLMHWSRRQLNRTHLAQSLRLTITKQNFMKLKSFDYTNDTVNRTKWQPTKWKMIFPKSTCDNGLIFKIYEEINYIRHNKIK